MPSRKVKLVGIIAPMARLLNHMHNLVLSLNKNKQNVWRSHNGAKAMLFTAQLEDWKIKLRFLVDTGADLSLILYQYQSNYCNRNITLRVAIGTVIKTHELRSLTIGLGELSYSPTLNLQYSVNIFYLISGSWLTWNSGASWHPKPFRTMAAEPPYSQRWPSSSSFSGKVVITVWLSYFINEWSGSCIAGFVSQLQTPFSFPKEKGVCPLREENSKHV